LLTIVSKNVIGHEVLNIEKQFKLFLLLFLKKSYKFF